MPAAAHVHSSQTRASLARTWTCCVRGAIEVGRRVFVEALQMKTLCVAVAMTIATASQAETIEDYLATLRSVSGRDDVTVMIVEEVSWPQLCRYSVSKPRFPDDEDMSLVYRKDIYVVYRECIGPRSRSPTLYTFPGGRLNFDPGKH
jgi:hypothetical protein